jgi:branched-chain amino acid transport system substrate-binding protein
MARTARREALSRRIGISLASNDATLGTTPLWPRDAQKREGTLQGMIRTVAAGLVGFLAAGTAQAQETIKIGVNEPLTGAVAASGTYVTNGARIGAEVVNRNGGVLGKKLELIIEDNKSNPKEAVDAAEKLILRDKVPAMIGAWSSTFTLAVMPKLQEYGVPLVVETSSSGKITVSGNPWVFRISPTSEMEAIAFLDKLDKFDPPIRKIDFLSVNNDFGRGAAAEFKKALETKGIKVGVTETMTPEATDLSAQLANIKKSDGDALFVTTGVEQTTLTIRQAAEQRLTHRIITTGGAFPDKLLANAGPAGLASYHILFFAPWFADKAKYPDVAKVYVDEWNKKGWEFAGLTEGFRGYDAVLTLVEALKIAGKAEPEAIRQALWKTKLRGVNGDIAFIKQGPEGKESGQSIPNVYVVMLKDGKVTQP